MVPFHDSVLLLFCLCALSQFGSLTLASAFILRPQKGSSPAPPRTALRDFYAKWDEIQTQERAYIKCPTSGLYQRAQITGFDRWYTLRGREKIAWTLNTMADAVKFRKKPQRPPTHVDRLNDAIESTWQYIPRWDPEMPHLLEMFHAEKDAELAEVGIEVHDGPIDIWSSGNLHRYVKDQYAKLREKEAEANPFLEKDQKSGQWFFRSLEGSYPVSPRGFDPFMGSEPEDDLIADEYDPLYFAEWDLERMGREYVDMYEQAHPIWHRVINGWRYQLVIHPYEEFYCKKDPDDSKEDVPVFLQYDESEKQVYSDFCNRRSKYNLGYGRDPFSGGQMERRIRTEGEGWSDDLLEERQDDKDRIWKKAWADIEEKTPMEPLTYLDGNRMATPEQNNEMFG
uniref:Uncharacterized protein n=1 Tax=Chromera velia CCMP2878 TaxID=1169474 RepID=A0A0G4FJM4_9ALVE|mmetsp:Transcript_44338/g.87550  ORF Transcript_44338/g.87550 Transcript_44338/m.87550 type:complete len:397 (-) Transcript_44338:310-1500(-)|eukprot:Cvel_17383.t1-p1 / transcript=Cvel_17383.t1 / gene=Cvel_17383 / organism=Chromera_velia_CCMP2878 / gene_product=hypothetical protein / transcript_product=hypothetical protein / location=Cvel_scaffold1383:7933-10485(+) / protein_length=396 / sequence_SO=supercontig / SO=protein_coding / is_pseudo=false